jgi:nicotinamide riboside kinase
MQFQSREPYQTVWVPEYGREYSDRKLAEDGEYNWRSEEFMLIAKTQYERENEAARHANKVLVCDTDAFATGVWHRRYLGERSPDVEAIAAGHRRPDIYLLTDINTPFVQDGTRDGELIREWMHEAFIAELNAQGRPVQILSGSWQERFRKAVECIAEVIFCKH